MMSLTFGLFTQVSDSGPQGPLVHSVILYDNTINDCKVCNAEAAML